MTQQLIYQGRKIQVFQDVTIHADGRTIQRDIVRHPGAVVILPLIDKDHLCLLRNHRIVVGETLWELPAGTLEPGEPPEQTARRELAEETGYRAECWRSLLEFYPSPGVLDERMYLFLAEDLTPGEMSLEPDEQLTPEVVPIAQALEWTLDGTIRDGKTLVGLLFWQQVEGKTKKSTGE